jgi:hypothetical protein
MGGCVHWLYTRFWLARPFLILSSQILTLACLILGGLVIYLIIAKILGCPELASLGDFFPNNRSKHNHYK